RVVEILDLCGSCQANETGCAYRVGCGWSVGWLLRATSGSRGARGRRVNRSGWVVLARSSVTMSLRPNLLAVPKCTDAADRRRGSMKRILASLLVATQPFGSALADAPKSKDAKVTLVYQHELPNVPGKGIKGVLVEYGPGGYSPGHTHAKSAFIYATVLEGAIRSQVNDGPVTPYEAGQSFSELPGDRHSVSANASEPRRARLLAVFGVDTS